MNSVRRPEPALAEDLRLELAPLCDSLDLLERGAFLFAFCEGEPLRRRLMEHIREQMSNFQPQPPISDLQGES